MTRSPLTLSALFAADVTRALPPVVHLHEQRPEQLLVEVSEYIVTRGVDEVEGLAGRMARLLDGIAAALSNEGDASLPAIWISGPFGSGKSSFAKLLFLALGGARLPDGTALRDALLARAQGAEALLQARFNRLSALAKPRAVVFDLGVVARDDEQIHVAALRQIRKQLGVEAAQAQHAQEGTSVEEVVTEIAAMLDKHERAGELQEVLFIVIDEVGPYLRAEPGRALKLQSFIAALGAQLKGRAWLVATTQQRLEQAPEGDPLHAIEARFPAYLRVHLDAAHTSEVVQRRMLAKRPESTEALAALFERHRVALKLAGLGAEELTAATFIDFYPLLPAYVELLSTLSSRLADERRARASEPLALRGLLQLLSLLFREGGQASRPIGALLSLDVFFPLLAPSLSADALAALRRVEQDDALSSTHPLALRVARAVALLELASERWPVTSELVAQALLDELGAPPLFTAVATTLDALRAGGALSHSERYGYRLLGAAGRLWSSEREDLVVAQGALDDCLRACTRALFASQRPLMLRGKQVSLRVLLGGAAASRALIEPRAEVALTLDVRLACSEAEREPARWVRESAEPPLSDRLVWVSSALDELDRLTDEACRARKMRDRYLPRRTSLGDERRQLLVEEERRMLAGEAAVTAALSRALLAGRVYLRGHVMDPRSLGATMQAASAALLSSALERLFPQFSPLSVPSEALRALLEPVISAPPRVLLSEGLGVLTSDAGHVAATCTGELPQRVFALIERRAAAGEPGASIDGASLLAYFAAPPFGHTSDLVSACLLGLLRAGSICARLDGDVVLTSVRDAGVRELFGSDKQRRAARFSLPARAELSARDRVRICRVLQAALGVEIERDNEAIADAFFAQAPSLKARLDAISERLRRLPGEPALPSPLRALGEALDGCRRARQALPTVLAIAAQLDVLQRGIEQLVHLEASLTEERAAALSQLSQCASVHLTQLRCVEVSAEVEAAGAAIEQHLRKEQPWLGAEALLPATSQIAQHYQQTRGALLSQQAIEVDEARQRLLRSGRLDGLSEHDAHSALRIFAEALIDTREDDTAPSLSELMAGFQRRLARAEQTAQARIDEALGGQVPATLSPTGGQRLRTPDELRACLATLERDALALLAAGKHVRLG